NRVGWAFLISSWSWEGLTRHAVFIRVQTVGIPIRSPGRLIEGLGFGLGLEVGAVPVRTLGVIGTRVFVADHRFAPLRFVESVLCHVPWTLPDPQFLFLCHLFRFPEGVQMPA